MRVDITFKNSIFIKHRVHAYLYALCLGAIAVVLLNPDNLKSLGKEFFWIAQFSGQMKSPFLKNVTSLDDTLNVFLFLLNRGN